jgi:signal transduction histidine kinase
VSERRRPWEGQDPSQRYDRLVAQAIHDARQQVATINALLKLADEGATGSDEALRHLGASAQHLAELLARIWDHESEQRLITVWPAIEDIVGAARLTAGARIEVDVDETATVLADVSLLRRATANLIDNAVRAAGQDGTVRFRIARGPERTTLEVEDSGPGFGAAPAGRGSFGLGLVAEFLSSVAGTIEIHPSDLGGTMLRVSVPDRPGDTRMGGNREGLVV